MSVFPVFGSWINQNMQQPLKAESKRSENVNSKDRDEMEKQGKLWRDAEKKHPWYDAPAKVTTEEGVCHMNIELTMGLPPEATYELFTNPNNLPLFSDKSWRQLLKNNSRKVLEEEPRHIARLEKEVAWDFLGFYGALPITLIVDENKKDLTASYRIGKMRFMKVFEGVYKVEPIYVDQERLCKNIEPKSREEYERCSGGQGKIASKVTMEQHFQPYFPFNLPPVSWYIRGTIIQTTKTLLKMLQDMGAKMRASVKRPH
ncbi:unnamed protein product [Microthlaspi erraticum]|uniref:DUF220 domain-containing protein n=1 Tax=Microthlaspi erraticum TaxID=1685480 RepID=A0A6D2J7U8_9BRAS|nr:unnamed protein product [Microthlaspi erraticum]